MNRPWLRMPFRAPASPVAVRFVDRQGSGRPAKRPPHPSFHRRISSPGHPACGGLRNQPSAAFYRRSRSLGQVRREPECRLSAASKTGGTSKPRQLSSTVDPSRRRPPLSRSGQVSRYVSMPSCVPASPNCSVVAFVWTAGSKCRCEPERTKQRQIQRRIGQAACSRCQPPSSGSSSK